MIDLHTHILPGLDDGVRSLDEACSLAQLSQQDGVRVIAATPHVRDDYPTSAEGMEAALADVRRDLAQRGIGIDVVPGGEVALDYVERLTADDLRRFSLGQTGRYLLVEFPYFGWPLSLERDVRALAAQGLTAVLAHPERNAEVQDRPRSIEAVVRAGALVQVTAASLDGRLGKRVKRAAEALVELGCAHVVASDAHAPDVRGAGLLSATRALKDARLARYLTVEAPTAIIAGEPLPPRFSRRS